MVVCAFDVRMGFELRFQERGKGLRLQEPESRRDAVSEEEDTGRVRHQSANSSRVSPIRKTQTFSSA